MLFVDTPFELVHIRNHVNILRSSWCHCFSLGYPECLHIVRIWHNLFRKYIPIGMIWDAWFRFPRSYSNFSVVALWTWGCWGFPLSSMSIFTWVWMSWENYHSIYNQVNLLSPWVGPIPLLLTTRGRCFCAVGHFPLCDGIERVWPLLPYFGLFPAIIFCLFILRWSRLWIDRK